MKGEERFGSESWIEGEILKERKKGRKGEERKYEEKNSGQRVKKEGKKLQT